MPPPRDDYYSFLLRLWLVPDGEQVKWRASLEDVQSGEIKGFSDVEDLLVHLAGLTEPHEVQQVVVDSAPTEDKVGKAQD
jgi:hypothetical protein